ncbi:adenine phosphoribosyltransferase [Sodaliphilus sp.]|uniref:adenine phosphoribosyltransferase n=1 Tax=Sodaliphilus sp. TaxID=2815818 RepID=UPI00389084B4
MDKAKIEKVKSIVRNVPDFPIKGIQFKDLTTAFKDPEALRIICDETYELYKDKGITKVVGIESRGFIIGAALAVRLGAGFVPIRKPGKLPADTISVDFRKEYGTDTIEIHKDAIEPGDVVLIHDDLLATGGTMLGALELVQQMNPSKVHVNFIIGLSDLGGRDLFPKEVELTTLFDF